MESHLKPEKVGKIVSTDFRKKGAEDLYNMVSAEAKHHDGKMATAIFALLREAMAYRELNKNNITILDGNKNVLQKITG